jgi:3-oxoadipyl-CoA thiolase
MNAYIIHGTRSAIGNTGGSLAHTRPDDLAADIIRSLLSKFEDLDHTQIADVILGCANQAGEDNRNVARMSALLAGLPYTVPAETVNRLCASGMSAAIQAARLLHAHDGHIAIAGGVESMTRAPYILSKSAQAFGKDAQLFDSSFGWRFVNPLLKNMYGTDAMGQTAENLAKLHHISRYDQDNFAYHSQQKAANAQSQGWFDDEITPINIPQKKGADIIFGQDEFVKPHTNIETLGKLKPAFEAQGTVTAGNASGLNDGAAALLMASEQGMKDHNLQPLAQIIASGVVGVEPRIMGIGPVEASKLALKKAGISLKNIDIIEINEAFAAQSLACTRTLGLDDADPRINPQGGAIALGHPLGMSGARLLLTAALQLRRHRLQYALCTMCVGVGQGYAVVLKSI